MNEECIRSVVDTCEHALRDVVWSERFLVYRGSRSSFYRVKQKGSEFWFGIKKEKCVEPLATARVIMAVRQLRSEFILRHYDVYVGDDQTVVVLSELMDYTLSDVLHRHHRLTECQTRAVAFFVLNALLDLHERLELVHADVKPSNIFLRMTGDVKLGDLSSAIGVNAVVDHFSGTVLYSPVEVLRDRQLASRSSSDIWALGVTLYQCMSGNHPFAGKCDSNFWAFFSTIEAAMQTGQKLKPLPHAGQEFHELLSAMLQWDPAMRPTARSLLAHKCFLGFSVVAAEGDLRLLGA